MNPCRIVKTALLPIVMVTFFLVIYQCNRATKVPRTVEEDLPMRSEADNNASDSMSDEIIRIAKSHLQMNFPDLDFARYRPHPEVMDYGDYWEVRWLPPENVLGGGPVVRVGKSNQSVTHVHFEQ